MLFHPNENTMLRGGNVIFGIPDMTIVKFKDCELQIGMKHCLPAASAPNKALAFHNQHQSIYMLCATKENANTLMYNTQRLV